MITATVRPNPGRSGRRRSLIRAAGNRWLTRPRFILGSVFRRPAPRSPAAYMRSRDLVAEQCSDLIAPTNAEIKTHRPGRGRSGLPELGAQTCLNIPHRRGAAGNALAINSVGDAPNGSAEAGGTAQIALTNLPAPRRGRSATFHSQRPLALVHHRVGRLWPAGSDGVDDAFVLLDKIELVNIQVANQSST